METMEFKIFTFWIAFTCLMWALAKIHFMGSNTNYNWKYFIENYSWFGVIYKVSQQIGLIVIAIYLFIKVFEWWFK